MHGLPDDHLIVRLLRLLDQTGHGQRSIDHHPMLRRQHLRLGSQHAGRWIADGLRPARFGIQRIAGDPDGVADVRGDAGVGGYSSHDDIGAKASSIARSQWRVRLRSNMPSGGSVRPSGMVPSCAWAKLMWRSSIAFAA